MMNRYNVVGTGIFLVAILLTGSAVSAQEDGRFSTSEAMIPMRDGVKLHTRIFRPKDQQQDLPIIFLRTPYGIATSERQLRDLPQGACGGRLPFRLPGHSRQVWLRGDVRDGTAASPRER